MVQRVLSWISWGLAGLGVLLILSAVLWPLEYPGNLYLGLGLLFVIPILSLIKKFLRHAPMPTRYGGLIEERSNPVLYRLGYLTFLAVFSTLLILILRMYFATWYR